MGYDTYFDGSFALNKPLDNKTREVIASLSDEKCKLYNIPGDLCIWFYDEKTNSITADGGKCCYYIEWIYFIVKNILEPKGYVLKGCVEYKGDEDEDRGLVKIKRNEIRLFKAVIKYEEYTDEFKKRRINKAYW